MLDDLQKALIKKASVRIVCDEGVVEIVRGDVVNAECGELLGEEAFFKLVDTKEYRVEPLDSFPPTTITSGWSEIKSRIFEDRGYSAEFDILFKDVPLNEDEMPKLAEWIEHVRFSGFVVSYGFILAYISGKPYYARMYREGDVLTGSQALTQFFTMAHRKLNIYTSVETVVRIFVGSAYNMQYTDNQQLAELRKNFALEGQNAILVSKERFEVFYEGLRIVNANDEIFTTQAFPETEASAILGTFKQENVKPLEALLVSKKDVEVLSSLLENNIQLFKGKIGESVVRSILQKHEPHPTDPESIIRTISDLILEAKSLGGKGWLRKVLPKLMEGIENLENSQIKEKLTDLFRKI